MSKKKELHKEIKTILIIYTYARQSFEVYKYMQDRNSKISFWNCINYLAKKDVIIELNKLLSKSSNQYFRLDKLINKLKYDGEFSTLDFDIHIINTWKASLSQFNSIMEDINKLRDKLFAHTDKDPNIDLKKYKIDITKFEALFDFIKDFIKSVYGECSTHDVRFKLPFEAKEIRVFQELKEFHKIKDKLLIEELNKNK